MMPVEACDYVVVFRWIDCLLKTKDCVNVAIDGNSGAGKTTLAAFLGTVYDCNIFHMDSFFLRPELKTPERLNEAGGNVDYVRFRREVIAGIRSGRAFSYRTYDCKRMTWGRTVPVLPKRLNIIEGAYSMHPALAENYDLKIFMCVDKKEQERRIMQREGPAKYQRYRDEWIPLEDRYFEELKIREHSDLVLIL